MRAISPKRAARIAAGKESLSGRSTFRQKSWQEIAAKQAEERGLVVEALKGKPVKPPKAVREISFSDAEKIADKWFSEKIRLRDADEFGMVTCVTCPHRAHWRDMQCGHFVTRGHKATRFHPSNANGQCAGCNLSGGRHLRHADAIDRKHGAGTALEMERLGRTECKRNVAGLLFLASEFRKEVEKTKEQHPEKYNRPK